MDIGKSFSFPFEDKQWVSKLGLGAVIAIVPILNFAWTGYMVGIIRNVMDNAREPLPNWDDLGKKFVDGFMLFLAGLVYALPVLLIAFIAFGMMGIPAMMSGNQEFSDAVAGVGGVVFAGLTCIFVLYGLVLSVIYPAIIVLYAREGTFASCFKFREVFDMIGKNAGPFFTAWGISLVAGLVVGLIAGLVGGFLGLIPCIGWILSLAISMGIVVYTSAIYAHLFGQFGRISFDQTPLITADNPV